MHTLLTGLAVPEIANLEGPKVTLVLLVSPEGLVILTVLTPPTVDFNAPVICPEESVVPDGWVKVFPEPVAANVTL